MLKATLLYAFLEKKMFCFIEDSAAIPLEGKKISNIVFNCLILFEQLTGYIETSVTLLRKIKTVKVLLVVRRF